MADYQRITGMAANDSQRSTGAQKAHHECLSSVELAVRLDEEVHRAARHRTQLSCLLVSLDEAEQLSHTYGEELPAQALAYLGAALVRQLRRFDRVGHAAEGELLVVLPGADEQRAEIVARRALGRLHSVKIEVDGKREPLRISVGIAAWREGLQAGHLLSQTRLAAQRRDRAGLLPGESFEQSKAGVEGMPGLRGS
jgi:diguanylate cyclase (GGDEF)-like protein